MIPWYPCGANSGFASETPTLDSKSLSFLAAVHGFSREEMFEARRILELSADGLAAERATPEQMSEMAEEATDIFASMEVLQIFLIYDIRKDLCANPAPFDLDREGITRCPAVACHQQAIKAEQYHKSS